MKIEEVWDIPDGWDGGDGIIAILIYRDLNPTPLGVHFLTKPEDSQQVAIIRHPKGKVIPRHRHLIHPRTILHTNEVLIVESGQMDLTIWSSQGFKIGTYLLSTGDIAILKGGGHGIEFLTDTTLYEVKQGPYLGRDKDKEEY